MNLHFWGKRMWRNDGGKYPNITGENPTTAAAKDI